MLPSKKSGIRLWLLGLPVSLALAAVALLMTALGPAHQAALAAGVGGPVVNEDTNITYLTLQSAIDAEETLNGHHLTVAPGIYAENVTITKSLTITGAGQELTILDGGGIGRVITIPTGITVTLSGVSVRNGFLSGDDGAGLYSAGALDLAHSAVYSNTSDDDGAGIANDGVMTLAEVSVYGNGDADEGGGIYNGGVLTLTNVRVYSNTAGEAGGIQNNGLLDMTGGEIAYNQAPEDEDGGLANYFTATLTNVRVHHNIAGYLSGGIGSYGYLLVLTNVDIDHNSVIGEDGYGGGLDHETQSGPAILNNVRIFANRVISGHANYAGGGISVFYYGGPLTMTNSAVFDNFVGAGGPGGGIHASYNARVWIIDSSIYNNRTPDGLGGGIDAGAASSGVEMHIVNSTISGNSAAVGGGLHSADPRVYITNTTFYSNSAEFLVLVTETVTTGGGFGGNLSGTVTLANTLLADGYPDDCGYAPAVTSNGYNLEHLTNSCGLAGTGDQPNANALLGPLARNGAALAENLSHLPLRGSDAIDAGNDAVCAGWLVDGHDQRGWTRPVDGDDDTAAVCDIGAVEAGLDLFLPLILR
jgi:hypothetical protein